MTRGNRLVDRAEEEMLAELARLRDENDSLRTALVHARAVINAGLEAP